MWYTKILAIIICTVPMELQIISYHAPWIEIHDYYIIRTYGSLNPKFNNQSLTNASTIFESQIP